LVPWCLGTLEPWNLGALEPWSLGGKKYFSNPTLNKNAADLY